jgi:DNA-binding PadR family transcriptional regulator
MNQIKEKVQMRGFHHGRHRHEKFAASAAAFGASGGAFDPEGSFGQRGPFGRGGPFGGGNFGGGGGRRGKRFSGEELRLMVLGLLAEVAPQHGYQLIRAFAEKSGEAYSPSPGVLYPSLTLLADMGQVAEAVSEGGSKRSYALTDDGRAAVEAKRGEIDAAFARLAAMAEQAGRTDSAPVRRAMHNLRNAAVQRLTQGESSPETAFAIAAILDEAAQKIERL